MVQAHLMALILLGRLFFTVMLLLLTGLMFSGVIELELNPYYVTLTRLRVIGWGAFLLAWLVMIGLALGIIWWTP